MKKSIFLIMISFLLTIGLTACNTESETTTIDSGINLSLTLVDIKSAEIFVSDGENFEFMDLNTTSVANYTEKVINEINSKSSDSVGYIYPSTTHLRVIIEVEEYDTDVIIDLCQFSDNGAYFLVVNTGENLSLLSFYRYTDCNTEVITAFNNIEI